MSRDDTAGAQGVVEELEVGLLEQRLSRTLRVRRVGDDDIEVVLVVVQELEAIANVNLDLGMVETSRHDGEILLRQADDGLQYGRLASEDYEPQGMDARHLVNVAEGSLLNALVLDNLTENTSVSTADDQDPLGVGVRVHGQVGDHLLVGELIPLGGLDDIVQDENVAVVGGLEDQYVLVLALLVVQDLLDLKGHGLAWIALRLEIFSELRAIVPRR